MAPRNPSARSSKGGTRGRKSGPPSPPDISIEERPAGRSTLSAILEEMTGMSSGRPPFVTIGYDEQPLDQNEVVDIHPATPIDGPHVEPEITLGEARPGFETMAIIDEELTREPRIRMAQAAGYIDAEVLELFTFVVLDRSLSTAATDQEKRLFVEQRLWHRLPPGGVEAVKRIDIRSVDESALMIRVWCAVAHVRR